jgi:enamine deaminase RidA (YjgF/YER057c/UK114 family)
MANIVHVTVHLASIKDLQSMDAAYASHFRGALPARTVVEVAHLPGDALVQISVIAGR